MTDTPIDQKALEAAVASEWQKLIEANDRTSPEEYPAMALITRDELASAMRSALSRRVPASGEPVGWTPEKYGLDPNALEAATKAIWDKHRASINPLNSWPSTKALAAEAIASYRASDRERTIEECAAVAKYGMERAQRDYRVASPGSHTYRMAQEIYEAILSLKSNPASSERSGREAVDLAEIERVARKVNPGRSEDHIKSVALDCLSIIRNLAGTKTNG